MIRRGPSAGQAASGRTIAETGDVDTSFGETCEQDGEANKQTRRTGRARVPRAARRAPTAATASKTVPSSATTESTTVLPPQVHTTCNLKCGDGVIEPASNATWERRTIPVRTAGATRTAPSRHAAATASRRAASSATTARTTGPTARAPRLRPRAGYCGDGDRANPPETCDLGSQNSAAAYGKGQCTDRSTRSVLRRRPRQSGRKVR